MSYQNYRNRVLAKGSNIQERIINNKIKSFKNFLDNSPNQYVVSINDVDSKVVIQDVKFEDETKDDKYILCTIDTNINVGDYIRWNNETWLVKSKENETIKSHQSVKVGKCNHNLKWIDGENKLIQKSCIVSAKTLYTTGIKDEKVIEIPNGMVGIQLPYDEDTKKLSRNQSFVFNKTKYKITFYDEKSCPGLIILICSETALNETKDDLENEIADRWVDSKDRLNQSTLNPEESVGITYEIDGADEIMWNQTKAYTVHKYNNGVAVDGIFTFALEGDYADIVDTTDNTVDIKARNVVYGYVTLIATDIDNGEIITKKILIKGLI